jgi:hypothetical protein
LDFPPIEERVMSDWNDTVIAELRANGGTAPSMGGAPLLILHSVGAKSGKLLSPLLYRERVTTS